MILNKLLHSFKRRLKFISCLFIFSFIAYNFNKKIFNTNVVYRPQIEVEIKNISLKGGEKPIKVIIYFNLFVVYIIIKNSLKSHLILDNF